MANEMSRPALERALLKLIHTHGQPTPRGLLEIDPAELARALVGAEALRTPVKAAGDEEAGENDAVGEPQEDYDAVRRARSGRRNRSGCGLTPTRSSSAKAGLGYPRSGGCTGLGGVRRCSQSTSSSVVSRTKSTPASFRLFSIRRFSSSSVISPLARQLGRYKYNAAAGVPPSKPGRWLRPLPALLSWVSRRTVTLPASTVEALKWHGAKQQAEKAAAGSRYVDHKLVFANERGGPLDIKNAAARHFKPLLEAYYPLPDIRVYDLRHTHVTHLLAAGTPVHVVAKRAGHASAKMTLDVYGHVLSGQDGDAVAKLEAYWAETGS